MRSYHVKKKKMMKKKNLLWHIFCLRFTLLNSSNGGIGIEKKLLNVSSIIFMNNT